MDRFPLYVQAHWPVSTALSDPPNETQSKLEGPKKSKGIDWFFATGVMMVVGLVATIMVAMA